MGRMKNNSAGVQAAGNRAVIYARYSPGPNQRDESIEGQIRECRAAAERAGLDVIYEYIDKKVSGTSDERPSFQQMLNDCERDLFDVVITWKNDRFARNRYDAAIYKQKLKKAGIKIIYAKENIPDGPEGIILESVLEGMAEWYSANLAQNIRRGLRENALKCRVVGGTIPLGYKMGPNKEFLENPETAPLVREIFQRYAAGEKVVDIANDLNRRGFTTALGKPFNRSSLHRIFANEKYIGVYRYEDILVEDGVPALIDKETFYACQKRADWNKRHARSPVAPVPEAQPKAEPAPEFLLTGKTFCGECGSSLCGTSGSSKTGRRHYYYHCHGKRNKKTACKKKAVKKDLLEQIVIREVIAAVINNDAIVNRIVDKCMEIQAAEVDQNPAAGLQRELAEVRAALKNIMAAIEAGIFTATTKDRLMELEARQADLQHGIAAAKIQPPKFTREQLLFIFDRFRGRDPRDLDFCRDVIDAFVKAVIVYNDRVVVTFNFTGPGDEIVAPLDAPAVEEKINNYIAETGEVLTSHGSSLEFEMMGECSPNGATPPPQKITVNLTIVKFTVSLFL